MNATVAQLAERHASNVDVAGSLPVGRSISEAIVDRLLENDEVEDFLHRHADAIHADDVIDALDKCGLAHDRIEHIEILPFNEHGFCTPEQATTFRLDVYGKARGKSDGGFYHIRAFSTFEQAVQAAKIMQGILGDLEISFEGKPVT